MFTRIAGFFAGSMQDNPVEACIAKAVEFMQKDIAIGRLVGKLEDLGFAFDVIERALPRAAEAFFASEQKKIALNRRFTASERRNYLARLEKRKASYLAKLEGVF